MEERSAGYPNRIEISEFGASFLRELPLELRELEALARNEKENASVLTPAWRRRGQGIDFQEFAHHTQSSIQREVGAVVRGQTQAGGDSRRKQQLHHENWANEQRLVRHRLADAQLRLEQAKYSEYDWQH